MLKLSNMNAESPQQSKHIITDWVELYTDELYSWAFHKTSDKQQAEDLVQETFITAFQQFDKFRRESSPKTWLTGILNNKISFFYRQKYRRKFSERTNEQFDSAIFTIFFDENDNWKASEKPTLWHEDDASLLDNEAFKKALDGCISSLPEKSRLAVSLKFIKQKKGDEICQELGIAATNFWQIIHRAKLMLRKCLDQKWFNA